MALPLALIYVLQPIISRLTRTENSPTPVLSLGYPDLLAGPNELATVFGEDIRGRLAIRPDGQSIAAWHGLSDRLSQVVETVSFFAALGMTLECVDISPSRGIERRVDLNQPLPADLVGRYQLVLDLGTIEHCFNIGTAMTNIVGALGPRGFVLHANPLSMFNHGFYNLNPTFYHDFYSQNGFEIVFMTGVAGPAPTYSFFDVAPVTRLTEVPEGSSVVTVARRIEARPIVWPTQSKYRANPGLKA